MFIKQSLYILFFSCFIFSNTYAQCNLYELSLTEKVNASSEVIEGKVIEQSCFWNGLHTQIYTSNIIEVYKVFKGGIVSSQVEVITQGGIMDDEMHRLVPNLELKVGDVGIFTLFSSAIFNPTSETNNSDVFQTYGSLQGFFKYDLIEKSATVPFKKYLNITNDLYQQLEDLLKETYTEISVFDVNRTASMAKAGGNISGFSPSTITAGTNSILTINGGGFGASRGSSEVQFKNADNGGGSYIPVPSATQYISWSDTKIEVVVPDQAGTGTIRLAIGTNITSSEILTISYAEMNTSGSIPYMPDHVDINSTGGLTWQMYTGFDSNIPAKESFIRAFNTWRCSTTINWKLGSTTSVNSIGRDGTSVIRFDIGNELSAGVLGTCYTYWSGCGTSVWYVKELDMAINDSENWEYGPTAPTGSEYDFETVMLHELGHGHQLGHVIDNTDVMNYGITNASMRRELNANNLAAGNDLMDRSVIANSCSFGPMVALIGQCAVGGTVADFSGTPLSGCAPLSVTFTDLSTENPTAWEWDINNDGTIDYTTQNPMHVYSIPGDYSVKLKVTNAFGVDSILKTNYISVSSTPSASFSHSISAATVDFTNTSTNATSYSWDFGDGSTSSSTSPSNTYVSAGTYTVALIAINSCGNDTLSESIIIGVNGAIYKPSPDFSSTSTLGCAPLSVTFTDLSTENPTSWAWDMENDGVIDYTTQNPTHVFSNTGNYDVKLIVTNGIGTDSILKTNYITIDSIPVAGFTYTVSAGTVNFTNTSMDAVSYSWDFGDGNTSILPSPTNTFVSAGTYTVSLVGVNSCGNDTLSESITIGVNGAINKPSPEFSASTTSGCTQLSVTFTDLSIENPISWAWDMENDGVIDYTVQNPTHVYSLSGTYSVKLIVTNGIGTDSILKTNYVAIDTLPLVSFSNTINKDTVFLTNNSTNANSYFWDFGDGSSSALVNPMNIYSTDGAYTISLTATNTCGNSILSQTVEILPPGVLTPPVADFSGSELTGCTSLNVNFTDLSTNDPSSWQWDVDNDGVVDYFIQNPSHNYAVSGNYSVKLKVSNADGSDSITKTNYIIVNAAADATFSYASPFCQNSSTSSFPVFGSGAIPGTFNSNSGLNFINVSTGEINLTTSSPGTYTVTNTLNASGGCPIVTATNTVTINSAPVAGFSNIVTANTVSFTNSSVNADTYKWSFGDSDSSSVEDVDHTYSEPNTYSVNLIASNACGSDRVDQDITIIETGINERTDSEHLHLFPNPTSGYIEISWTDGMVEGRIMILNYLGEMVYSVECNAGLEKLNLDLSTLTSGIYCILTYLDGQPVSKKLVINK